MGNFSTKLKLGGKAFGVSFGLDPTIQRLNDLDTLERLRKKYEEAK